MITEPKNKMLVPTQTKAKNKRRAKVKASRKK